MKRKIYNDLLEWKNNNIDMPLMVIGARQIGKTYTINEFCKNEFKDYIYFNLFEDKGVVSIYKENISSEEKFHKLELYIKRKIDLDNTIIFFDEIQESEELISSLKYYSESDKPYKIICAGSLLGVKVNRFTGSFPVGKVRILEMNSMSFEEFLYAYYGNDMIIKEIENCFRNNKPMSDVIHGELIELYNDYLIVGGMPASVSNYISTKDILLYDKNILSLIIESYLNDMNKYLYDSYEKSKIENIYKSIPAQLGNQSNKFQYSKVEKGARSKDYYNALSWLTSSKMIIKCEKVNKIEKPLKAFVEIDFFKLYLNDSGLLSTLLEIEINDLIFDDNFMYKGIIAENYVGNELLRNKKSLYYWDSGNKAEIDFLISDIDGIIPIEVKASTNNQSKSLKVFMEKYKSKYGIRISLKNFGFENNIKSVPLYATFCIK